MRKILISVLIILLLTLTYFAFAKGIKFLNIKSINNIKATSNKLESDFNEANDLSNKTYPEEVERLEDAIKKLKISKQKYDSKNLYNKEENSLGTVEIKTYKIHYLWTILGNYRKDRGVQSLNLDLKSTQAQDVYDLQFTLIGNYTSITDFLYDIENDEELNFEIKNFVISSQIDNMEKNNVTSQDSDNNNSTDLQNENTNNATSTTSESGQTNDNSEKTSERSDGITLQAKFTVQNIGITLD